MQKFAGTQNLQFALRELHEMFSKPRVFLILAAISVAVGIAGPFGTGEAMPLGLRVLYWAAHVVAGFVLGSFVTDFLRAERGYTLLVAGQSALATGLIVTIFVIVFNGLALGDWPDTVRSFAVICLSVCGIAGAVHVVMFVMLRPVPPAQEGTPLLDRLPVQTRGPLVHISVDDHYVHVTTKKGRAMLLMRLGDAIRETGGTKGMRVHRSHWVASEQVIGHRRDGNRVYLSLSTGTEVPVSRSYLADVRAAGLLGRRDG